MSIKHGEMNQQVTQNQVNDLLTHQNRVAVNMQKETERAYDPQYYSLERTKEDRQLIDQILKLPASTNLVISDEQKYRLQAMQGRNLSHILVNSNQYGYTGDSEEMKSAKESVEALELLLSKQLEEVTLSESIEQIETAYLEAISACRYYYEHKDPSFRAGQERKQAVYDVFVRLQAESEQIAVAKKMLQNGEMTQKVTNAQDLLVYAQQSIAAKEKAKQQSQPEATGIPALTFDTFARMIGTHNRGQVEFDGKGLKIINNGAFSLSSGSASLENRQVRERFLAVVMEKLGEKQGQARYVRLRQMIGLDNSAENLKPITRDAIYQVVSMVNDLTSVVDQTLKEGKAASVVEHRFALEVDQLIGGNVAEYERSNASSEQEKLLKKEINSILERARKAGANLPELTRHQMDNLVKGNVSRLRDEIFLALNKTYQMMSNLNGGAPADFNALAGNQNLVSRIAAYTIMRMTAQSEDARMLTETDLNQCMKEAAFQLSGKESLERQFKQVYVENLAVKGALGLDRVVEQRLAKNKSWQADTHKVNRGLQSLKDLAEKLQNIAQMERKAFQEGLTEEEAQQFRTIARDVDTMLTSNAAEDMEFVANELKDTRFGVGFAQAKARISGDAATPFAAAVQEITQAATRTKEKEKLQQEPSPLQKEQEKGKAEENKAASSYRPKKDDPMMALLDTLNKETRSLVDVLRMTADPSTLIKSGQDTYAKGLLQLQNRLRSFPVKQEHAENLNVMGINFRLEQSETGLSRVLVDGKTIPLPFSVKMIADRLELGMVEGRNQKGERGEDLYGSDNVKRVIDSLDVPNADGAEIKRIRNLCLKVIAQKTDLPGTFFDTTPTQQIHRIAQDVLTGQMTKQNIEDYVGTIQAVNENLINDTETLELLRKMILQKDQVSKKVKFAQTVKFEEKAAEYEEKWTQEEEQVKDLIADLIYSKETWKSDEEMNQPGERVRKMLQNHMDAVMVLISNPKILESIFSKIQPPSGDEEDMQSMVKDITDTIGEMLNSGPILELKEKCHNNNALIRRAITLGLSNQKVESNFLLKNLLQLVGVDAQEFEEMRKNMVQQFAQIDAQINDSVESCVDNIQSMIETQIESAFKHKDEEHTEAKKEDSKAQNAPQAETLDSILESVAKGDSGQGLFLKNVMTNYFKSVPIIDKRSMLASALRSVKPHQRIQRLHELKPLSDSNSSEENQKIQEENRKLEKENEILKTKNEQVKQLLKKHEDEILGNYLGGFLKGAGPLLQKMLQGMPVQSVPNVLKDALKDMKSNLAPISQEIVTARLLGIVDSSGGSITEIEVTKSLGAASVGQVFQCKIYGPNLPKEGQDVVVKLLRPDARNRMMREKKVMLEAAKATDAGMEATYKGQLERIEEELDLRIEAQNVEKGMVYNDGVNTVQTVKVNDLVAPTSNTLVMEKAPGTNLDKYLKDSKTEFESLYSELLLHDKNGTLKLDRNKQPIVDLNDQNMHKYTDVRMKLVELLNELKNRQVYVTDLCAKWVEEGIFGRDQSGFYHGDLHAGNIMIDSNGLTVIDFGNATQLNEDQQRSIIRMMLAAYVGEAKDFLHEFHKLISEDGEENYQKQRAKILEEFQKVMSMGEKADAGKRIAAALVKAQQLGVELPPEIANFSQCQLRLQNAVDEMNKLIRSVETAITGLEKNSSLSTFDTLCMNQQVVANQSSSHHQSPETIIAKHLDRLKGDSKENFLAALKGKDFSGYDKERVGFLNIRSGFISNPEALSSIRGIPENMMLPSVEAIKSDMLEKIHILKSIADVDELDRINEIEQEVVDCMKKPFENMERFQMLCNELLECRNLKAFTQGVDELVKAYKEESTEDTTEKENQLFELLEQVQHRLAFRVGPFSDVGKNLSSTAEIIVAQVSKNLEPWFTDPDEKHLGTSLREAYDQFRTAQKEGTQDLAQKERDFLDLYRQITIMHLEDQLQMYSMGYETTEPKTFFDVMGEVLGSKTAWSLSGKIGFFFALSYKDRT